MIQLLPCPACSHVTALAQDVSLSANLRCPHCEHTFRVGQVIEEQYGLWEVVSDPAAVGQADAASYPNLAPPEPPGLEAVVASSEEDEPLELSEAPKPSQAKSGNANWAGFEPVTHEQFEKLKRKQRSPIWSILQVVLGGLAAIPIALLILWHGLGRDVLDAGPQVAEYLPWIVPAQFHPPAPLPPEQTDASPQRPRGGFRNFDDILPSDGGGDAGGQEEPAGPPKAADATGPPSTSSLAGNDAPTDAQAESDAANQKRIEQQFPFTRNLFASIESCEADLLAWIKNSDPADGDPALRKPLAKALYGDLLSVADGLNQFPGESFAFRFVRQQLQSTSSRIKRHADVQELIQQGAAFTLGSLLTSGESFPVAAIIENQQAIDEITRWKLVATGAGPLEASEAMQIYVPEYLSPLLIPGQRLLVLGVVEAAAPETAAPETESSAPKQRVFHANYLYSFGSQGAAQP